MKWPAGYLGAANIGHLPVDPSARRTIICLYHSGGAVEVVQCIFTGTATPATALPGSARAQGKVGANVTLESALPAGDWGKWYAEVPREGERVLITNRVVKRLALSLAVIAALSCGGGVEIDAKYQVQLRYLTPDSFTDNQMKDALEAAVTRIEGIVTKGLAVGVVEWTDEAREVCGVTKDQVPTSETLHGLTILVSIQDLGDLSLLAESGPCVLRGPKGGHLPLVATMKINQSTLSGILGNDVNFRKTVLHEMLHTLGFGTLWPATDAERGFGFGLLDGFAFIGEEALAAAKAENGAPATWTSVPVENSGEEGTLSSHWRMSVFGSELMVGWLQAGDQPLSATTIASLGDLGYGVDLSKADSPYTILSPGIALRSSELGPGAIYMGDDVRHVPPLVVDESVTP